MIRVAAIVVVSQAPQGFAGVLNHAESLQGEPLQTPLPLLELMGSSPLQRTVSRLQQSGVEAIHVISTNQQWAGLSTGNRLSVETTSETEEAWVLATCTAREVANTGFDLVLVIRMGPYVEFSLDRLVENHRDRAKGITRLYDQAGPVDIWLIDAERIRKNLHLTSARELLSDRPSRYGTCSYVNRLDSVLDLRRLALDILLMRCATRPGGTQIKPGIWIEADANVDKSVRLVGPSYVGRGARIRRSVLLTRFSHVESHCEIDFGTALEDSSILSNTYIGPSLDVTHAVVSGSHITHLQRNVALQVLDPLLVSKTSTVALQPLKHRATAAQWMGRFIQTS